MYHHMDLTSTSSVYAVYNLYPLFLLETDKQFVSSTINDGGQVSKLAFHVIPAGLLFLARACHGN